MKTHAFMLSIAAAATLAAGGCNRHDGNSAKPAQTPAASKAAGGKTISAGLGANSKFLAAAKSVGLDQTLAGPGPYTVFVPDDAAFDTAALDTSPANRAQVTSVITNLVLPGTVLAEDIDKLIDQSKGKGVLATMGGGTLMATKEGGKTVLTDALGHKATITTADEQYSNGTVHHIDGVLMPKAVVVAPASPKP